MGNSTGLFGYVGNKKWGRDFFHPELWSDLAIAKACFFSGGKSLTLRYSCSTWSLCPKRHEAPTLEDWRPLQPRFAQEGNSHEARYRGQVRSYLLSGTFGVVREN